MTKTIVLLALVFIVFGLTSTSHAQQEGFIGEIRMFAGNFAPRGWALCEGQMLSISQNQALFSILGTTYGGDGRSTFALPDMRGRVAIHPGQGPGLSPHRLGDTGGQEAVTLTVDQMPSHTHSVKHSLQDLSAAKKTNDAAAPSATTPQPGTVNASTKISSATVSPAQEAGNKVPAALSINPAGGGQAHENRPPYVAINYIICVTGVYPSRN